MCLSSCARLQRCRPRLTAPLMMISQRPCDHWVAARALAATQWSHGRWLIIINGAVSRGRQRWSLAHELKHILDHPFVTILYPKGSTEPAKQACDYFAGCLLMPRRWLRRAWSQGSRDGRTLARLFGVTPEAVKVRLLQVGLIEPTALCLVKEA